MSPKSRLPLLALLAALLLSACASPAKKEPLSEVRLAEKTAHIQLPEPISFRYQIDSVRRYVRWTLPPGDYVSVLQDDDGVYFESAEGTVTQEDARNTSVWKGGIYRSSLDDRLWVFVYPGSASGSIVPLAAQGAPTDKGPVVVAPIPRAGEAEAADAEAAQE